MDTVAHACKFTTWEAKTGILSLNPLGVFIYLVGVGTEPKTTELQPQPSLKFYLKFSCPGWPWTPPLSSWGLGLQVCTTMPISDFKSKMSDIIQITPALIFPFKWYALCFQLQTSLVCFHYSPLLLYILNCIFPLHLQCLIYATFIVVQF